MSKPLIAVTMGDPAGVGPEIVAKSLASEEVTDVADCVIVGDRKCMENAIRIVGADLKINVIQKPAEGQYEKGILNLIDLDNVDMDALASSARSAACAGRRPMTTLPGASSWRTPGRWTRCPPHLSTRRP